MRVEDVRQGETLGDWVARMKREHGWTISHDIDWAASYLLHMGPSPVIFRVKLPELLQQ